MYEALRTVFKVLLLVSCMQLVAYSLQSALNVKNRSPMPNFKFTPGIIQRLPAQFPRTILFKIPTMIGKIIKIVFKTVVLIVANLIDTLIAVVWNFIPVVRRFKSPRISKFLN